MKNNQYDNMKLIANQHTTMIASLIGVTTLGVSGIAASVALHSPAGIGFSLAIPCIIHAYNIFKGHRKNTETHDNTDPSTLVKKLPENRKKPQIREFQNKNRDNNSENANSQYYSQDLGIEHSFLDDQKILNQLLLKDIKEVSKNDIDLVVDNAFDLPDKLVVDIVNACEQKNIYEITNISSALSCHNIMSESVNNELYAFSCN